MLTLKNIDHANQSLYKTYTITIDESKSDPSQMVSYWADVDIAQGSSNWDTFFGAYPVLLSSAGVEYKKLNPSNFQQDIDWNDVSSLTSWGNYEVMIAFPRMWYKASKSWDIITIQITDNPDNYADGFKYYAHTRGNFATLSSSTNASDWASGKRDKFYLWAYKWFVSSSKLHSWYNQTPSASATIWTFRGYAGAVGTWFWQTLAVQERLLEIYSLFKYKTTNLQSALWRWYCDASWSSYPWPKTWVNTYNQWMNYWTSSWTVPVKFLGLEHRYGGIWEWVDWLASNSNWDWAVNIPVDATGTNIQDDWHGTGYKSIGSLSFTSGQYIKKMKWETDNLFYPQETGWSETTYYTDCARWNSGARVARFGGLWNDASKVGAFCWDLSAASSSSYAWVGARLMFL